MSVLWIAFMILSAVVMVQGVALVALYSHFGALYASSPQGRAAQGPAQGEPLPRMPLNDIHGRAIPHRTRRWIFASTDCPLCEELKEALSQFPPAERDTAIICAGEEEAVREWAATIPSDIQVAADQRRRAFKAFDIVVTPFYIGADPSGRCVTKGLVNDLEGLRYYEEAMSFAGPRPGGVTEGSYV